MKYSFTLEEKDFQFIILGHSMRETKFLGDWIEQVLNKRRWGMGYIHSPERSTEKNMEKVTLQEGDLRNEKEEKSQDCVTQTEGTKSVQDGKVPKPVDSYGYEVLVELFLHLTDFAYRFKLSGNLWQAMMTYALMAEESVFGRASEIGRNPGVSLMTLAKLDAKRLFKMFWYGGDEFREFYGDAAWESIFHFQSTEKEEYVCKENLMSLANPIGIRIQTLAKQLADCDDADAFLEVLLHYYQKSGVGKYGLYKSFIFDWDGEDQKKRDVYSAIPIERMDDVSFDELVGYETQKQQLIQNTESFVMGKPANNCLLYGDSGTGKSTCIRSVINMFMDRGLRLIEIPKFRIEDIPVLVQQLRDKHYRFILYMDDLSFEDFESDYKHLKAIIEGGVNQLPKNFIVYATTNRRHLVKENWRMRQEMDDDIFRSETIEEVMSLSQRFGNNIYFSKPTFKEYLEIVKELAKKEGLEIDEEDLLARAKKWELEHGGVSGRTARQFINDMKSKI